MVFEPILPNYCRSRGGLSGDERMHRMVTDNIPMACLVVKTFPIFVPMLEPVLPLRFVRSPILSPESLRPRGQRSGPEPKRVWARVCKAPECGIALERS